MKKYFVILLLFLLLGFSAFSQTADAEQEGGKIAERMREYIQNNLGLSKNEAERFSPVFMRYIREFAQTHRENRDDRLILQQKIIELRLRYRGEFRQILDEQRANKVFQFEDKFRQEAVRIIKENRRDRLPLRRTRSVLLQ
jgi:siroheme synthase (precorrin-2 oxidase/ferrochelatase)